MRVLVSGFGSRGDLQPLLALGLRLRERGHEVRANGPPDAQAMFTERGFSYTAVGPSVQDLLTERAAQATDAPLAAFRELAGLLRTWADLQFDVLEAESEGVDAMVYGGLSVAAASVGRARGIPAFAAMYTPQLLPSAEHPPTSVAQMNLPGWVNRALWWLSDRVLEAVANPAIDPRVRRLGLEPQENIQLTVWRPGHILVAADPELAPACRSFDPELVQTGFWHLPQQDEALSPEVEDFLSAGPPPVYLGFGSMPDPDPARTTAVVYEAVRRSGVRVLLSRGWAGLGDDAPPEGCLVVGATPHGVLFPRLAGAVHHGGSGTVGAVGRAGIPRLLVPQLLDQFYWARCVERAGVGPASIRRRRLDATRLTAGLRRLVEDDAARERAAALGRRMRETDGVGAAVRVIERRVGGR